ncbi:unnamed protein product [Phyllotreta striolata]|uniref:Forkhead box protein N3 n=1 Tax=Phyllotreta striolata TaxID=444603 RepID=A0A9N9XU79_PHYSR|nr:unnamed protein product [Phyllotreta striolata]
MAPERAVTPQEESRLSPKMSVPASPIAGTPIRDAQSPISMLLAVAQSRSDDDLTNLNWLHERDILKGMIINPSPSDSANASPNKHHQTRENIAERSTPNSTDESVESSDGYGYSNPNQATAPPRNKHPLNVPYDPRIHTSNKPPYSFSCLIFMAIEDSVQKALPVKEIYAWILDHFPYFKNAPTGWKNSVRHNLSLNKCFQKVEKAAVSNLGKGSLWTVDPQYKPNLIQALNRSPFHPVSTLDASYKTERSPDKPSLYRLPNPELFPYLARKLASAELSNGQATVKLEAPLQAGVKTEDSLDAVDAAAVMLSLKHGQPNNGDGNVADFLQVITNSPSQDHTYSAADGESEHHDDRIPKARTCRRIDFEDDEDRRIKEGAETLLNLAGITLRKRRESVDGAEAAEGAKRQRHHHRQHGDENEPREAHAHHFKPRLLRKNKKASSAGGGARRRDDWANNNRRDREIDQNR